MLQDNLSLDDLVTHERTKAELKFGLKSFAFKSRRFDPLFDDSLCVSAQQSNS